MFLLHGAACALSNVVPLAWFDLSSGPRAMRLFERLGSRHFRAVETNGDCAHRAARREEPGYRVPRGASAVAMFLQGT